VIAELYRRLVFAERSFRSAMIPFRRGPSHDEINAQQAKEDEAAVHAGNDFMSTSRRMTSG
jgi:hypothetical protein